MGENKISNLFPPILGFAELVRIKEHQALYKLNEQLKFLVTIKSDTVYIDESHDGKIIRISEGKSLKEAFINHYTNYDPEDCPFHHAWLSKVTSLPFVYADNITKADLSTIDYPRLCSVDIRIPFDAKHLDLVQQAFNRGGRQGSYRTRFDQCLHITVYPGEVVKTHIPVLSVRLSIYYAYLILKAFHGQGLMRQDKRFRAIVNRPGAINNHSIRIFNGAENDEWLRYVISFKEL